MRLQFLGSGDAFGSGGRLNTCLFVESGSTRFLLDCGASSLIAMKRCGVRPNSIDTIILTHLHADHFGGIPFFILEAQFSKRGSPLTIAGPPGLRRRFPEAMEVFFQGSSQTTQRFELRLLELESHRQAFFGGFSVIPYAVEHGGDAPSFALRVEVDGRILTYSGDTEWCSGLAEAAHDADLFVCEAYFYEKEIRYHLNLKTLEEHLPEIRPKRLIITHMSEDMLTRSHTVAHEIAEDGKTVEL
ncbi:MAG: MBL fold metallo-hydrolase [Thermodesulfobacteriota bacterium]